MVSGHRCYPPSARMPFCLYARYNCRIDQCYENGGYDTIDYGQPPVPPLDPDGAAWAEKWLRAKGVLT